MSFETATDVTGFPCDHPDCFVSHSWHDDFNEKWDVLVEVRRRFIDDHGREPIFWIDKYCIDQTNPKEGIKYLPVFLMACDRMLVIAGKTYFERLWCEWELFTMSIADPTMNTVIVWSIMGKKFQRHL